MHRSVLSLAAAALVLAGCDSAPTSPDPASAAPSLARGGDPGPNEGHPTHEHKTYPYEAFVMNTCPPVPELVWVEGTTIYNSHFKFIEDGNNSRLMANTPGTGVGLVTGTEYQFHQLWTLHGRYTLSTDRWETEQTTRYHVISKGSLGNFFTTLKTKVIHDDGAVTTEVVSVESACRG